MFFLLTPEIEIAYKILILQPTISCESSQQTSIWEYLLLVQHMI